MEVQKLSITAEELNAMPISSYNSYDPKNRNFNNATISVPTINDHPECPGGFLLTGNEDGKSNMRISKVFDSNRKYVVSFDIKGSQTTESKAFDLEYNDNLIDTIYLTNDNDWKHYEYIVDVKEHSNIYDFIDFGNIGWVYIFIKNIQVKKLNSIGYSLPVNMTMSNQIFEVYDANDATENGITYWLTDNAINKPSIYGGIIKTANIGTWIFQTFHGVTNGVWVRTKDNWREFKWGDWKELTNV